MKIYTKTGDQGETGLLGGKRVSKNHAVVSACGDVDETNCQVGLALSLSNCDLVNEFLRPIQEQLFVVGGELANCMSERPSKVSIGEDEIVGLENAIDELDKGLADLDAFILPGGCAAGAVLHVARGVCRRAERSVVELMQIGECRAELRSLVIYLNRLSDFLFVAARCVNFANGEVETKWLPR